MKNFFRCFTSFQKSCTTSILHRSRRIPGKRLEEERLFIPNNDSFLLPVRSNSSEETVKQLSAGNFISIVENMKNLRDDILILDVRELHEIEDTGVLAGGINIPFGDIEKAFSMTEEEFYVYYSRSKPKPDSKLILSCPSIENRPKLFEIIRKLKFTNVYEFRGGWHSFAEFTN